jgi:hypothetical protein
MVLLLHGELGVGGGTDCSDYLNQLRILVVTPVLPCAAEKEEAKSLCAFIVLGNLIYLPTFFGRYYRA